MIRVGVYRKKDTITPERPQGFLYQLLTLARNHYTDEQVVVYIPLRIEPEWTGPRFCCSSSGVSRRCKRKR